MRRALLQFTRCPGTFTSDLHDLPKYVFGLMHAAQAHTQITSSNSILNTLESHARTPSSSATHCARRLSSTSVATPPPPRESPADQAPSNCWRCSAVRDMSDPFFCEACGAIQPAVSSLDYFQLLGFGSSGVGFDLNLEDLEARYKNLQRRLHPDRFSTAEPLEQEYSAEQASAVNQAYDVLRRPLRRAHYLLSHLGRGACEGLTISDPEILEQVMEAREIVEEENNPERLRELGQRVAAQEARCIDDLSRAFASGDLDMAAEATTALRYLVRIQEAIIEKM